MNNNSNNETNGSILDQIKEQTSNLEAIVTANNVVSTLADAMEDFGRRERISREATLVFKHNDEVNYDKITDLIEVNWVEAKTQAPVTYWKDKEHSYAQFANKETKLVFLDFMREKEIFSPIRGLTSPPNSEGHHLKRKPIRIIIPSVPETVKPEKLDSTLKKLATSTSSIGPLRAGKSFGTTRKMRSLMTSVDANGFSMIFKSLGGAIPYNEASLKIRVYPRIACKPWSCKDCYYIGPNHTCEGKACGQCGNRGHLTKECKTKTRYCTNCKRPGHRAKDSHCPIFVREIVKELKRMDLPLEYLESKTRRTELIKLLSYK